MYPIAALTVSAVARSRSRHLLCASRRRLASARALIDPSRQAMRRQNYRRVVCAWCQVTRRFEPAKLPERGQVSHRICYACFEPIFQELSPVAGANDGALLEIPEQPRGARPADPVAGFDGHRGRLTLPADALLTPGALDTVVPLLPRREARRECAKFGHEVVILFP